MILNRYLTKAIIQNTATALLILGAIFSFFALVEELGDTGRGNYGVLAAIQYICLSLPDLIHQLLTVSIVIGSMVTIGRLVDNHELIVIRSSGVSQFSLAYILLKTAMLFIIVSMILSEFVIPISQKYADDQRSIALNKQPKNLWLKHNNNYISISHVIDKGRLQDIHIYSFDDQKRLKQTIHAQSGEYHHQQWQLEQITIISLDQKGAKKKSIEQMLWEVPFNPETLYLGQTKPNQLSLFETISYIRYLSANHQSSQRYQQVMWAKLMLPLIIIAMILLPLVIVSYETRQTSAGLRIFIGVLIGAVFRLFTEISQYLGLVYELSPWLSIVAPVAILLSSIMYCLQRFK